MIFRKKNFFIPKKFFFHLEACCAKVVIVRPMLSYIVGKLLKNACQLKNPRSATLFRIEVIIFWRDFFAQKQTFFSYSEAHCSKLVSGNPMLSYIVRKLWKRAFQQKNPHITTTFSIGEKKFWKKNFFKKFFFIFFFLKLKLQNGNTFPGSQRPQNKWYGVPTQGGTLS